MDRTSVPSTIERDRRWAEVQRGCLDEVVSRDGRGEKFAGMREATAIASLAGRNFRRLVIKHSFWRDVVSDWTRGQLYSSRVHVGLPSNAIPFLPLA